MILALSRVIAGHVAQVDGDGVGIFGFKLTDFADEAVGSPGTVLEWFETTMKVVDVKKANALVGIRCNETSK